MNMNEIKCNFHPMEILKAEIPVLKKIEADECWYLGERLNREVNPVEVQVYISHILMKIGEDMRIDAIMKLKSENCIGNCDLSKYCKGN